MPQVELRIVYDLETRGIRVEGAINDKLLSFGMLEVAKETITEHHRQMQNKVQLANGPIPPGLKLD